VKADTLGLGGTAGVPTYDGAYVGPISATFNGQGVSGGAMCIDPSKTSHFNSTWGVVVSTINPQNLTASRLGDAGLSTYQQVAWLLNATFTNPGETGEIQFAAWRLIDPVYIEKTYSPAGRDIAGENAWMLAAKSINPNLYDWKDVKIYTPTESYLKNQEFVSGHVNQTPIPGTAMLLFSGVSIMAFVGIRKRNV
jgi:hypothetical protein